MIRIFEKNGVVVAALENLPLMNTDTAVGSRVHLLTNGDERFLASQDFLMKQEWADITDELGSVPFEHRVNLYVDPDVENFHTELMNALDMGVTMAVDITVDGCTPMLVNAPTDDSVFKTKPQLKDAVGYVRYATSHMDMVEDAGGTNLPVVAIILSGVLFADRFDELIVNLGYASRDEALTALTASIAVVLGAERNASTIVFNLTEKQQSEGELPE